MAKAFMDCGHVEPDDGARVLTLRGDLSEEPLWTLELRFCLGCAKRIDAALRADRWFWKPIPRPVKQH